MSLIITLLFLFISICSFGQRNFPDDYRKGGIEVNTPINDLSLYSLDSLTLSPSDLENKVTFINYWFVGCRGCRQEEDFLREISQYFSENGKVQFVGITPSNPEEVKEYLKRYGDFGFPVYTLNGFKEVKKKFNVKTFPHNQILVDGIVVENLQVPIANEEMKDWLINKIKEELRKVE